MTRTVAEVYEEFFAQFEGLFKEAEEVLHPFVTTDGAVVLSTPGYVVTAIKA